MVGHPGSWHAQPKAAGVASVEDGAFVDLVRRGGARVVNMDHT